MVLETMIDSVDADTIPIDEARVRGGSTDR
jgi:hypothetical protein